MLPEWQFPFRELGSWAVCQRCGASLPQSGGQANGTSGCRRCAPCCPAETEIQDQAQKKIAAAIYEYQADCDGEWGEISLDFEKGTAEIIRLADWDTMRTNRYANRAIAYLLNCEDDKLPKETMMAFEP